MALHPCLALAASQRRVLTRKKPGTANATPDFVLHALLLIGILAAPELANTTPRIVGTGGTTATELPLAPSL